MDRAARGGERSQSMPAMVILGAGTAVPDADRGHTHLLWHADGQRVLVDAAGDAFQRLLRAGHDPVALTAVILTHDHADHIAGVPGLLVQLGLAGRTASLPIYGPAAALTTVQRMLDALAPGQPLPLAWHVAIPGAAIVLPGMAPIATARTRHSRVCLALRFSAAGRSLTYTADTAPCPAIDALAAGTDYLLHEAGSAVPSVSHSTPGEAGAAALRAGARHLVLVHFSPRQIMSAAAIAAIRAAGYAGAASIAEEGDVYAW
jgi:ribonuclease Z